MLSAAKKRLIILSGIGVVVWLLFRYTIGKGIITFQMENITRAPGTPVLVTVFYEALCPDSKHFITKQLLPAYKSASTLFEVVLVPYGKASTSLSSDGTLQFDCQHGPLECQANIYHACVIDTVTDKRKRLETIACMIKDNRLPKEAFYRCAHDSKLDEMDSIQKCHDTRRGSELLKLNGEATHALRPPVSFIPTITIDGSQGKQAAILKNLIGEICKAAQEEKSAYEICKNN